jgi:uncharacterized protein
VLLYQLDAVEVRVLGCLIEKQNTTPDYYPLTLNGLMNACNQKTNREPVSYYDESTLARAIDRLREKRLAWMVQAADARVPKYEHNFDRELGLTLQEVAVMCVLLLRGPQTVGELRGRSARIYPFESLEEVTVTLKSLVDRNPALVMKLPTQPGQKEARFCHLMSGEPDLTAIFHDSDASDAQDVESSEDLAFLREEVTALREEVASMREALAELEATFAAFKSQFE